MLRDLRLIRLGVVGELRNPAFRLLGVVFAVAAGAYAWGQGPLAGATAVALSGWAGRGFALACCLWFGTGALRDQDAHLGAVLRSKPVDGARWVWVMWATGIGLWAALLGCLFLGAMAAQLPAAGPAAITAHLVGYGRALLVMIPLGTLGFALCRITRSPLGATVMVLAFVCVLAGLQFVAQYLRPDYTQNLGAYLAASAAALVIAGPFVERFRRGELRRPLGPALALLICVGLTAAGARAAYRAARPPEQGSIAEAMSYQYLERDRRVPGFWLPDGRGGMVRTSDYPGRVLLVYLFAAGDMEAARTLRALDGIRREFADRGVQPLAICFSSDRGDGAALAWTAGLGFPIGADHTTVKTTPPPDAGLVEAYNTEMLPLLVVTDRRRRVRDVVTDPTVPPERLRALVQARLAEEPE